MKFLSDKCDIQTLQKQESSGYAFLKPELEPGADHTKIRYLAGAYRPEANCGVLLIYQYEGSRKS